MALIKNSQTGETIALKSHHVFGRRTNAVNTLLEDKQISKLHAIIQWDGQYWTLQDYSKNGTKMDQNRLIKGEKRTIQQHSTICFAGVSNWHIVDLSPPATLLLSLRDSSVITLQDIHALPNDESPQLTVYQMDTGEWAYEDENGSTILRDGDIIYSKDDAWQFHYGLDFDQTEQMEIEDEKSLASLHLSFHVSLDEEHVTCEMHSAEGKMEMGERVHHYLLVHLARQRLADADTGVDPQNQGWCDLEQLSKELGIDIPYINKQIFRARKQIDNALPPIYRATQVIERRKGQVRFGRTGFSITRGTTVEGDIR